MGLLDSILSAIGLRRKSAPKPAIEDEDERDLELEKIDDAGSFDFSADIARYFTAEFRIETAWDAHARRDALFREYGVEGVKHWYQIKATFERWLETPEAKAKFKTPDDLLQARMTTTQTMSLDDLDLERVAKGVQLEPFEGVSLERWAKAEAALEGGAERQAILDSLELDDQAWTRASAEWHARMKNDPSGQIANEYSKFAGSGGAGKLAASAKPS